MIIILFHSFKIYGNKQMATTKIITQAEAFKLINWLESHNKQLFADVAITMASLCLRVGDTVNLKFSQFKEGNTLEVLESKTGKNHSPCEGVGDCRTSPPGIPERRIRFHVTQQPSFRKSPSKP